MVRRGSTVRVRQRASRKLLHIGASGCQKRQPSLVGGHKTDTYSYDANNETARFTPLLPPRAEPATCSLSRLETVAGGRSSRRSARRVTTPTTHTPTLAAGATPLRGAPGPTMPGR